MSEKVDHKITGEGKESLNRAVLNIPEGSKVVSFGLHAGNGFHWTIVIEKDTPKAPEEKPRFRIVPVYQDTPLKRVIVNHAFAPVKHGIVWNHLAKLSDGRYAFPFQQVANHPSFL